MTCPNCGAEFRDNRRFCGKCGAEMSGPPAGEPDPPASAPTTPPTAWGTPGGAMAPAPAPTPAPATDPFAAPDLNAPPGYAAAPPPPGYPPPPAYPPPAGYPPPPGYGGQPAWPGYGYAAPSTNGWAVASLALGAVGWLFCGIGSVLAIVFGFMARDQIRRSGGHQAGDGMAIAGIVLGAIGVVLMLGLLLLTVLGESSSGGS